MSSLLFLAAGSAHAQGGTVTFGGGATAGGRTATPAAPAAPPAASAGGTAAVAGAAAAPTPESEWQERDRKLNEGVVLGGGVGLLHTQHAQGGAPGQFRLAFTTEYFSAGFLCTTEFPCRDPRGGTGTLTKDTSDHIGGHLSLSMQFLKWLEGYVATSAIANSNEANRPALIQVLGDSVLGAKAHGKLGRVFHVGGAFDLLLVNGTGSVGLDGGGTSARFRALGTVDLRDLEKRIPLRVSVNTQYVLDNTGQVVEATEAARRAPVTRIERFGLNVNRVDHFDIRIGAELFVAKEKVRPFLEYGVAIPVNRQGYLCRTNNPSRDKCLANESVAPSSLTLGGRFFPWKGGFNLLAALDVGITGVGTFIEEVRPTPPWTLYLGGGWAFDTWDRPPVVQTRLVETPVAAPLRRSRIKGFVHEDQKVEGVAGAIVTWDNRPDLTGMVTGADGRFTTPELDAGPYSFTVKAEGFRPSTCTATLVSSSAASAPAWPARPGAPPPPPAPPASGPVDVMVDCPLVALPKVGAVVGKVVDVDAQSPVEGAAIKLVDSAKKELSGAASDQGAFRFEAVGPGAAEITVTAEGYLALTEKVDVTPRKDNPVVLQLKKRPKNPLVTVGKQEIVIKQQIQFALDSAAILPQSTGLLLEIADVLQQNPRIRRVEVQGHTDNTGSADHNKKLSEDRAASVVTWLTNHGVAPERLGAVGFGQTKPLVPNVTANNRAKNRRVQFIIKDQDPASAPVEGAPKKGGKKAHAPLSL